MCKLRTKRLQIKPITKRQHQPSVLGREIFFIRAHQTYVVAQIQHEIAVLVGQTKWHRDIKVAEKKPYAAFKCLMTFRRRIAFPVHFVPNGMRTGVYQEVGLHP